MKRQLFRIASGVLLLASLASIGCASAVTSIDRQSDGTYILTGQTDEQGDLRGFVWEGTYDATARVFTIRKKAICPP